MQHSVHEVLKGLGREREKKKRGKGFTRKNSVPHIPEFEAETTTYRVQLVVFVFCVDVLDICHNVGVQRLPKTRTFSNSGNKELEIPRAPSKKIN